MWEYITLAISSVLALIGASLNTEKDEKGKSKTVFKRPNGIGWLVILLLGISSMVQLIIQIDKDADDRVKSVIAEGRRKRDSTNIHVLLEKSHGDSLSFIKQFELLNSSYEKQVDVLTGTNSIIGKTNSLLHPLLPMVVMFKLRIPFQNPWMSSYVKRISKIKDSLNINNSFFDIGGIDNIAMDGSSFVVGDTTSYFYIDKNLDGVTRRFLDPGYYIYFFKQKPPIYHSDVSPDLFLEATNKVYQPWPSSPFGDNLMAINFNDSCIYINVFYKIDNYPNKGTIKGVNDILGKYMLITSQMPNKQYKILSVLFFTGADFSSYITIPLSETENISDKRNNTSVTRDYLHKIVAKDLQ